MLSSRTVAPAAVLSILSWGLVAAPGAHATGTATSTYVGGAGFGDGGPATSARLTFWNIGGQVTTDPQGRVVFADPAANEIRRIDDDGTIERIAGTGDRSGYASMNEGTGYAGDGGPATDAQLNDPTGVQIASDGTMYIADAGNDRIRKVATDGTITTLAGTGSEGTSVNTVTGATSAVTPKRLRLTSDGNLYFTEFGANAAFSDVRVLAPDGDISFVAGSTSSSCAATGAIGHCFQRPTDVVVDSSGNVFVSDLSSVVDEITGTTLTQIAGATGNYSNSGDGSAAAQSTLNGAYALALDQNGNVLVQTSGAVRAIVPGGSISTDRALPAGAAGISMTLAGTSIVNNAGTSLVSVATDGTPTTIAGGSALGTGDGLPATEATFRDITAIAAGANGTTLIGDGDGRVWGVGVDGVAHRLAGTTAGQTTFSGEGGQATDAVLPKVVALAAATDGTYYIGTWDGAVRKVDTNGVITTVAGTGIIGNGPDAATPGTEVAMFPPYALAVTPDGSLDILDGDNHRLRQLSTDGTLTTIAGLGSAYGRTAVGQPLSALDLHGVASMAMAPDGSLRFTGSRPGDLTPVLYTVADGTVTKVQRGPDGLVLVDAAGNVLLANSGGIYRQLADGSEDRLTDYDGTGPGPLVMGFGADGELWWAHDGANSPGLMGLAGERLWRLAEPGSVSRPASPSGVSLRWDSNGPYVSWNAPAAGVTVLPVLRAGADNPAAGPDDGFAARYYPHNAMANTASVVFNWPTDEPMTAGHPFTITLFAQSADGNTLSVPTVATFLLVFPTTCTAAPSARTVLYGKSVTVTGALKTLGTAVSGKPATITAQAVGRSAVLLKSGTTTSAGTLAAAQAPAFNTTYTFRHAVDTYAACAGSVVVTVQPKITVVLAATTIHRGTHTTLTTIVGPNLYGQYVTLQHLVGTTWRTVSSLKLNRYSRAAWAVGSSTAGTFHYRVVKAADKYHAASVSPVATLKVT